jgi:hypothetical protein
MNVRSPLLAVLCLSAGLAFAQASAPVVTMYKHEGCGCCGLWAAHLQKNGFAVRSHEVQDVGAVRRAGRIPDAVRSCHTAFVGKYAIEGHVPASAIQRLLKEQPKAVGLAVAGMPAGSPGMEGAGKVPYEVLLVLEDGSTRVYSRH